MAARQRSAEGGSSSFLLACGNGAPLLEFSPKGASTSQFAWAQVIARHFAPIACRHRAPQML